MTADEVAEKLSIKSIKLINREIIVQPTSAVTGEGLFEGFHYLSEQIRRRNGLLNWW